MDPGGDHSGRTGPFTITYAHSFRKKSRQTNCDLIPKSHKHCSGKICLHNFSSCKISSNKKASIGIVGKTQPTVGYEIPPFLKPKNLGCNQLFYRAFQPVTATNDTSPFLRILMSLAGGTTVVFTLNNTKNAPPYFLSQIMTRDLSLTCFCCMTIMPCATP